MSEFISMIKKGNLDDYYSNLLNKIKQSHKIFLFGGGFNCYRAIDWIKSKDELLLEKIHGVIDNNSSKWGEKIGAYNILPPDYIIDQKCYNDSYCLFIITCGGSHQVIKQLNEMDINRNNIVVFTISHNESFELFPSFFESHLSVFESVFNMLSDEKSKKVFVNLINFRLTANFNLIEEIADEFDDQYFDKEIIKMDKESIYLDCGAYIGDTVDSLINHNYSYKKIISIEADPNNYETLCNNVKKYHDIFCVNCGVWNKEGEIRFETMKSGASNSVSDNGDLIIPSKKIDDIVINEKVTHIKMDIEGAEVPALIGAFDTIQKNKPTLAICIYHKVDDFITIPMLIKSLCPEYKIFIRHYQKMSALETVCYAVYGS